MKPKKEFTVKWDYVAENISLNHILPLFDGDPEPTDFKTRYTQMKALSKLNQVCGRINFVRDKINNFFTNSVFSSCRIFINLINSILLSDLLNQSKEDMLFIDKDSIGVYFILYPELDFSSEINPDNDTGVAKFTFNDKILKINLRFGYTTIYNKTKALKYIWATFFLTYNDLFENDIGYTIREINTNMDRHLLFPVLSVDTKEITFNLQFYQIQDTIKLRKVLSKKIKEVLTYQINSMKEEAEI